ncbi:SDR family NAD(P)-dependent oxidoreductase [Dokdonella sp.]|uniref:SDR family NAD(P)-dependent oxidoreductase n=1 Tax=Dokdonella sp. TaxID=2291710 RepID=UPI003527950A
MSIQDFSGKKVAVITASASSGFGHEFARLGAELGMSLVLADVQAEALQAVSSRRTRIRQGRVLNQVLDVSDAAQVDALAEATAKTFGEVHLLFNNAGVGTAGLIWENSVADWQWTPVSTSGGVVHGMRAFVPRMLASAKASPDYQGHVVNTASMAGLLNPPASGISQSAVVSLSESLHHDLSLVTTQVHCSVLCPFYVPTGISTSQRGTGPRSGLCGTAYALPAGRSGSHGQGRPFSGQDQRGRCGPHDLRGRARVASISPHTPKALEGVRQRAEDIVAMRNPTDPLAACAKQ